MTATDMQADANSLEDSLRAKSGWVIALGVVYVFAGLVALSSVAFARQP